MPGSPIVNAGGLVMKFSGVTAQWLEGAVLQLGPSTQGLSPTPVAGRMIPFPRDAFVDGHWRY
jgi:hypothetical protein